MADQTPETNANGAAEDRPSALKNPRVRIILAAVLALVVVGVLAWFVRYESYGKYQQSTNDAYVQADGVTVSPKVSGYVDQVFVEENQAVKAGDPLVRIDSRDYNAQAAQATAQIDVARANAAGV
ncbi:MAG: biotin/lipoyl-binding protein, partial [Sphingomonas bacterium]